MFRFHTASLEDDELHQASKVVKTVPRFQARNVVLSD